MHMDKAIISCIVSYFILNLTRDISVNFHNTSDSPKSMGMNTKDLNLASEQEWVGGSPTYESIVKCPYMKEKNT
jgi:hypothetical protein